MVNEPADLWPTLGWQVIDWIETELVHGVGDVEGQPIRMADESIRFLLQAYEIYPKGHPRAGRRRYPRAFLSRRKGWAKSERAAMICCAEALGPVRFDGWDAQGEPVGAPVTSPEVLCVATEEGQAGNTYDNIPVMLLEGEAARTYGLNDRQDVGRTRVVIPSGGSIEPITAGAVSKDGGKSSFIVWDEVHLWTTPQLRRLYGFTDRNLGKRKLADPWGLLTSTMYLPGEKSVAESIHEQAKAGRSTLLFDHLQAVEGKHDLETRTGFLAALEEASGEAWAWTDPDLIWDQYLHPSPGNDKLDMQRYWLNIATSSRAKFFPKAKWDSCAAPDVIVEDGEEIAVGFDGSDIDDSTVLSGCRLSDGHLFTIAKWERLPDDGDDWEVPRGEVETAVVEAFRRYRVRRMYCDPEWWHDEVDRWTGRYGKARVHKWRTNRDRPMAAALERIGTAVAQQTLTHDADPAVDQHIYNATRLVKRGRGGIDLVLIVKPVRGGPLKIDGAVSHTLAYEARADCIAAGEMTGPRTQVPTDPDDFVVAGSPISMRW
jgi:hypothetical protein